LIKIITGAEKAFFEALLDGYVGGKKNSTKTTDPDGYKIITWEKGDYKVVDRYCVTPLSDFSEGTTTIFHKHGHNWVPVWWMSYGGRYPKWVIPFLKFSLKETYGKHKFCDGRGEEHLIGKFPYKHILYLNMFSGDFSSFEGNELIRSIKTGHILGFHKYFGMAMI
jgi:hypothetical protein